MSGEVAARQGIGAPARRKEDARLLRGRGAFVADMTAPGLQEVVFLRSPIAHGRLRAIRKPAGAENAVFVRQDLASVRSVQSNLGLPGFRPSNYPPLAEGKVRFVGEPVAICVAPDRARGEDLAARIHLDMEQL